MVENSPLLPVAAAVFSGRAQQKNGSPRKYYARELEMEIKQRVHLGRWSTILTFDAVLSVLITATIILAICLIFPNSGKNQTLPSTAYLTCGSLIGYWMGRWHVPKQTVSATSKPPKPIPDHRASMRSLNIQPTEADEPDLSTRNHLILSLLLRGTTFNIHPSPFRRQSTSPVQSQQSGESTTLCSVSEYQQFGRLSLSAEPAVKVKEYNRKVQTVCTLQGLDLFLTDAAPESVCEHPAFVEAGLRDKPMFVLNTITHVGNIILYFELPGWVRDWNESLREDPFLDTPPIAALKRFLRGTDDYRNERLLASVAVVDAPMVIQLMAPEDSTTPCRVVGEANPGIWRKYAAIHQKVAPALELQLDMVGSRAIRTGVGLLKRHLQSLVMDMALLIDGGTASPGATIGCFRLDHVDFRNSPEFPLPHEDEVEQAHRASQIIRESMTVSVIKQLAFLSEDG